MTEFGGVPVRGIRLTVGRERIDKIARVILVVILFSLVVGIWTSLWVRSAPIL